jgi:putative transposon-encoded protein
MPLYTEAFPVGRITSEGDVVRITKSSGYPKLLISPGPDILPNIGVSKRIFGAIIEATSDLAEERAVNLFKWAEKNEVPFVFVISPDPPTKPAILMIEKGYPYWGWEPASLATDCSKDNENIKAGYFNLETPFSRNFNEIRNKATGLKKVIVPVKESNLNSLLIELRKIYFELARSADSIGSSAAKDIAKRFLGCIYALEEMTSPIAYAETELGRRWGVIPLKRRINALKSLCESARTEDPLYASFAARSVDKIIEAYSYMAEKKSGKHLVILQIIKEAALSGKSVLFVSKNEALNEALKLYLEVEKGFNIASLRSQRMDFTASSRLGKGAWNSPFVDTCILYGCPRYYQRDIFSYAKAKQIGIIAYESEIPAIKYIQDEIDTVQKYFSNSAKVKIAKSILGTEPKIHDSPKTDEKDQGKTDLIIIEPQDAEMGDFTPEAIFSDFLSLDLSIDFDYANEAEARSADQRLKGDSDFVVGAKIFLPGGRHIMLHAEKHVQIYDESTEKVKERVAKNLKRGDLLILIENSTRKSLAESIISKVESLPSMMQVVVFQKAWSYYLKQALEESGDRFDKVIEKITAQGAREPKTPGAIYLWINGTIIGPHDLENIRRIGVIYNKPFLIDHFKEIAGAVQRLRSIHRSLARRLNRLIPRAGIEADQEHSENTVIDEELDLYLEDFAHIVSMERIESVDVIDKAPAGVLDKVVFN